MTTPQLPAHLANRQRRDLVSAASAGLGATLPPHCSIRGNTFTLVDAAGKEYPVGATMDIVIADVGEHTAKRYYPEKWTPDSNDPPACFSIDGVVPSPEAAARQARSCAECQWNMRGSAVSAISGAQIKACRDEKWLAFLLPQYPNGLFQLVLTPGSFGNFKKFLRYFAGGVQLSDVVVRLSFEPKVNGVLQFEIVGYAQNQLQFITPEVLGFLERAWAEKKTDVLVGRGNATALPAPASSEPVQQVQQQIPQQMQQQVQQPALQQQPMPEQAPPRRRRRTAAEIAAEQGQAPMTQVQPTAPQAPFMPAQNQPQQNFVPAAQMQPAANAAPAEQSSPSFGIQQGFQPDPTLTAELDKMFGPAAKN